MFAINQMAFDQLRKGFASEICDTELPWSTIPQLLHTLPGVQVIRENAITDFNRVGIATNMMVVVTEEGEHYIKALRKNISEWIHCLSPSTIDIESDVVKWNKFIETKALPVWHIRISSNPKNRFEMFEGLRDTIIELRENPPPVTVHHTLGDLIGLASYGPIKKD